MKELKLVIDGKKGSAEIDRGYGDSNADLAPISCIAIQPTANGAYFVTTDYEDMSPPQRLAYKSIEEVLDVIKTKLSGQVQPGRKR